MSNSITLTKSLSVFLPDEPIQISFHLNAPFTPGKCWIGLIPANIDSTDEVINDKHDVAYFWVHKKQGTGTLRTAKIGAYCIKCFAKYPGGNYITSYHGTIHISNSSRSIIFHFNDQQFERTLSKDNKSWNNNDYLQIIKLVESTFHLSGSIELFENDNDTYIAIDDVNDIKSAFEHADGNEKINVFVKLTRFRFNYNTNSFYWTPPIYLKTDNETDDQKQWDTTYETLLNKINEKYAIDMFDIKLEIEEKTNSIGIDDGCDLMSQWNFVKHNNDINDCTKNIKISIIETINEDSNSVDINNNAFNCKTISQSVIDNILGENNASLTQTKNVLLKIESAINVTITDDTKDDTNAHESVECDEKLTEESVVVVKDDIVDETNDLFASTKNDLISVATTQCQIQQTICLLKEILKYEPKTKYARSNIECKKLWNTIYKFTQNTIIDMQTILNMKTQYINNMKNIGNFINDINSADDMDELHIKIDEIVKLQSNYDSKIQESTDNALNTLRSVIEKFIDPTIIEKTENDIKKYRKLLIKSRIECNILQKNRSNAITPIVEDVRKIALILSACNHRIYDNKNQLESIHRLMEGRQYGYQVRGKRPTACLSSNKSEAAPNETIVFDLIKCRDCNNDIPVKFVIDFGDGSKLTKTKYEYRSQKLYYFNDGSHRFYECHQYTAPGEYIISLTIWNEFGNQATTQISQKICKRKLQRKIKLQIDGCIHPSLHPFLKVLDHSIFKNQKCLVSELTKDYYHHYYSASISLAEIGDGYILCRLFDRVMDRDQILKYFQTIAIGSFPDPKLISYALSQNKYRASFNSGVYGSYCLTPFHKYRASFNSGSYGNYVTTAYALISADTIFDVFKLNTYDKNGKEFNVCNHLWSAMPDLYRYDHDRNVDYDGHWYDWHSWKSWKYHNPNKVLEDIQIELHQKGINLETEVTRHNSALLQMKQKLMDTKIHWKDKINKQVKNINEYKQKFQKASNDMNNIIKRTGVKQRDIYDFLTLTKNLIPIMIKDQQSTNSLSAKFTLSYDLIKRNLGPKRNSYSIKLYLQNTQQYLEKLEPYIIKLNNNKFIYMGDIQCETKQKYNDTIFGVLLTVNIDDDEKKSEAIKYGNEAEKLLQTWGLSQYFETLKENKYDNPLTWCQLDNDYLRTKLKFKPGHAKKFEKKIAEWINEKIPVTIKRKFESLCIDNKEWKEYYQQSTVILLNKQQQLKNHYFVFNKVW